MIGILIAIQINNANENRKNEQKILSLLDEIQNDLSIDILKLNSVIEYYTKKDSFIWRASTNQLTYDDYKKNGRVLMNLTNEYEPFTFHNNSYNNLMRNIDHIPKTHESILNQLNKLYVEEKSLIDEYNEHIKLAVMEIDTITII